MPSRLSSLLVRDGLVGVKRMEHAFQRQVIYGGCLDTILLEMSLVQEERLVQYLSLATGLPPATRSEIDVLDAEAITKCPVEAARAFRVVPLCFEEGALRVVVHDPVDLGLLEELANDLEFPVQPLVVPEYRFHLVFARTYGGTPNARFVALAQRAEESSPTPPVGRARTIIVEESAPAKRAGDAPAQENDQESDQENRDVPLLQGDDAQGLEQFDEVPTLPRARAIARANEQLATATTEPLPMEALREASIEATEPAGTGVRRQPRATMLGVGIPGAGAFPMLRQESPGSAADSSGYEEAQLRKVITAPIGSRHAPSGEDRVIGTAAAAQTGPTAAYRQEESDLPGAALTPAQARAELSVAADRDLIFELLLRALHYHAWYTGLLTVQGAAAIGRIAIVGSEFDHDSIGGVLIPLDVPSSFRSAVESAAPHVGPIASGDPEIDSMIQRMSGIVPATAALLPVVLRNRVVAIAVAHNGDQPLDVAAITELFPLAGMAADAILRLLVKAKAASKAQMALNPSDLARPAQAEPLPPPPAPPSQAPSQTPSQAQAQAPSATQAPSQAQSQAPAATETGARQAQKAAARPVTEEIVIEMDEPDPIDVILDAIESDDRDLAARARAEALRRLPELGNALAVRFPGKLVVDRYELGGRILPAPQHGPLLALVVDMGQDAADLLIAKMDDSRHEVRYYATLCAEEIRPRAAVEALVERLFDSDYGTRNAAISALSGYAPGDLDKGLLRVRQALHSENSTHIQAAANAVARLADTHAIPDLLDAVARGDKGSDHARRALIQLTAQDHGTSVRKWRAWWSKHREQHRIEWLIEGLNQKDVDIRRAAVEELRKLTGEFFDYQHDAPKREREPARQRWAEWWNASGRTRYTRAH
jgi:hypothetical protein